MKLSRNEGFEILDEEHNDYIIISDNILSHSRWSVHHELIIKNKSTDRYYKSFYSVGATEMQDESPWEYENEIEFEEVFPIERKIVVYNSG